MSRRHNQMWFEQVSYTILQQCFWCMEQKSNTDLRDSNARARGRGQSQGALVGIGVNGLLLCWLASMKSWIILVVCCGEEQIERSFTADNKFRVFLPVTVLKMIARGKSPWSLTRESSWFSCWECHGFKELFIVTLVLSLHAVEEWTSRGKLYEMLHSPMPNSRTGKDFLTVRCLSDLLFDM